MVAEGADTKEFGCFVSDFSYRPEIEDLESRIVGLGGKVINPMGYFLDPTESFYRIRIENESLYYDNAHLSIAGARLVLLPCLKERLILAETESSKRDEG